MRKSLLLKHTLLAYLSTQGIALGSGNRPTPMQSHMDDLRTERNNKEKSSFQHMQTTITKDREAYDAINQFQITFLHDLQQNYQHTNRESFLQRYQSYLNTCRNHGSTLKNAEVPFAEANYAIILEALSNSIHHTPLDIRIQHIKFRRDQGGQPHTYASYIFFN